MGGRSTFMVELDDVSKMLSLAREQNEPTLLIVDEFGRGTSTYDGYTFHNLYLVLRWHHLWFMNSDVHI